jgi:hypothetical protein
MPPVSMSRIPMAPSNVLISAPLMICVIIPADQHASSAILDMDATRYWLPPTEMLCEGRCKPSAGIVVQYIEHPFPYSFSMNQI